MKTLFLILYLSSSLSAFAQRLAPPIPHAQDSLINKRDTLGRKTGLWVKYFYDNGDHRRIVNTGNYSAGKKIGTWKYYPNNECLVCLDTSKCTALTEIYESDGSVTIVGLDRTFINSDLTFIQFTRMNDLFVVTSRKNKLGEYDCTRVYKSKTTNTAYKTFTDFENALYNLDTKW